ncbi:DUF1428 domain-containing protein [Limimaricola pyoseonensis]|uniref:Uncharacterized conserved protein YbaA, DUF1428 family n=1 Tax=Limimaricola pyoseonensis TaxID=521013 RepID=A0A1G7EBR1_9RHOB|nr:DUF1428 domain-containing protein [Limimaricola pyoseonensis]SDE60815.1 Uncharacterized conserved protein YbaA, DUF1428 family [Limimaricola pyoseonensis]
MSFIDGFVVAVPNARKDDYIALSRDCWPLFKEYGAVSMRECWGVDVPDGEVTSFPMAVKKTPEETVVFSWIEWPDRAARDACMANMESDPRWEVFAPDKVPFDGKRMIFGGFETVVEA